MRTFLLSVGALLLLGGVLLPGCGGGGGGGGGSEEPTVAWLPLIPGLPQGTPATCVVEQGMSNDDQTVVDVEVPGLWMEDKEGPDGRTYQHVWIPGFGSHDEVGAPDLPLVRMDFVIPTTAQTARIAKVEPLGEQVFDDVLVWPQPIPEMDDGTPEEFRIDQQIYGSSGDWPATDGELDVPVGLRLRSIPVAPFVAYPVRWDPATRRLTVPRSVRYTFSHPGDAVTFDGPITRERATLAASLFPNWEVVRDHVVVNYDNYDAAFLMIYPEGYDDEMQPFVDQKKERGFFVTERTTAETGTTCAQIRTAIQSWAAPLPLRYDLYCLLVGDTGEIPLCTAPTGTLTDDLYASTDGDDLDEEVYLGRLSVDDETDCANQVDKILTYEDDPSLLCCYREAALWAHKQGAPGKYEGAHESVRTATYAHAPIFHTHYGSQAGVLDQDVVDDINDGIGLVAYRGHGSTSSTATSWNQPVEYFNSTDVGLLTNSAAQAPVVWSFTCSNAGLNSSDCIAEVWMEQVGTGAVSYYGATEPSATSQNHELDRRMFKAVYDLDLLTQSHAIEYGEAQMAALVGSSNAWRFLLLGDPDMKVRRRDPLEFVVHVPVEIRYVDPPFPLEVFVELDGEPVAGALVALYMPLFLVDATTFAAGTADFLANHYTDEKGRVTFLLPSLPDGQLHIGAEDAIGHARTHLVDVVRRLQ